MKRRKHSRTSRKDFPLAIDLRNFLMYSNPSRFAPKLKKNGGEAYPQAPSMNEFFDYGQPTPQTPFVFQNGGAMNDIQKMREAYKAHYGVMQNGGSNTNFMNGNVNRTRKLANKIKETAYKALQKNMTDEALGFEEAAMMFQQGGMYNGFPQPNFSNLGNWNSRSNPTADMTKLWSNFTTIGQAALEEPTETYIKRIKTKPIPAAQDGLQFRSNLQNQMNLPFDYSNVGPQAGMMYGVDARNTQPYQNVMTEAIPGMGTPMNGMISSGEGYGYGRNLIPTEDPYGSEEEWITPSNPTAGMSRDEALAYWRKQNGRDFMSAEDAASLIDKPADDPNYPMMQRKDMRSIREKDYSSTDLIKSKDIPQGGLRSQYDYTKSGSANVQKTLDELQKKREEEAKKKEEESNCPDGKCGKPGSKTVNIDTQGSGDKTAAGSAPAGAAGMTPGQYRTFLSRVGTRRALLPGNRLKYMDFVTYGPGMNSVTGSANKQNPFFYDNSTGKWEGAVPAGATVGSMNQQQQLNPRRERTGNFLADLFARRGNYRGPQGNTNDANLAPQKQITPGQSQFDPRGYNSEYSDFRNQVFQNRRRNLGEKIDALYARSNNLRENYKQDLSPREYDRIERLEGRYNRVGERRRPTMMTDGSAADKQEQFIFGNSYQRPQFKEYGGDMGYFQPGGGFRNMNFAQGDPADEEMPQFVTDMQGNQTALNEKPKDATDYSYLGEKDLASTYQGDIEPVDLVRRNEQSSNPLLKTRVKFGQYNPYEAPLYMAGLDFVAGAGNNLDAANTEKKMRDRTSASNIFATTDMSKGDWSSQGYFRPNQQVPVQFPGFNYPSAKMGGGYKKGGEYYLTEDEINELIQNGGQVEFLD